MRNIDGITYISAREYAEMMNLTPARVSQIKAELPFVKFEEFGIELINFDLLSLSQVEKTLAQTKFQTATPIHELSYKDLANYFGKSMMELVNFKGSADSQINDLQAKAVEMALSLQNSESENAELSGQLEKMERVVAELNKQLVEGKQNIEELEGNLSLMKNSFTELSSQHDVLTNELHELKIVHGDIKHELEIKIIENKGLSTENENLKNRINSMELSAKNDADFKEEFKAFKDMVMKKIK